jgi:hypothetical protein
MIQSESDPLPPNPPYQPSAGLIGIYIFKGYASCRRPLLTDSAKEVADIIQTLPDFIQELLDGTRELPDGTQEPPYVTQEFPDGTQMAPRWDPDGTQELPDVTPGDPRCSQMSPRGAHGCPMLIFHGFGVPPGSPRT